MSMQAIRRSIVATDKIRKMTKAMQLVSANHLSRAVHLEKNGKPYVAAINDILSYWMVRHSEKKHPYFIEVPVHKQLIVVFSSDKGLCGALNVNIFRQTLEKISSDQKERNIVSDVIAVGEKALQFFGRSGLNLCASVVKMGNHLHINQLAGIIKIITDGYNDHTWQRIILMYPTFVNTMLQTPTYKVLLPVIEVPTPHAKSIMDAIDYIYEPCLEDVMDVLLVNYIDANIYQAALETAASEQAARMVAMQNATDNAEQCKHDLERNYHKARQSAITQEIAEITAGSETS